MLLKLVLLAYSYGIVSCRKIERFARENIVAMWLTQEQRPTYRTIARFIVSKELIGRLRFPAVVDADADHHREERGDHGIVKKSQ